MKKFLLSAVCIVAIAASGLAGYAHYQQSQIDPAILENLEALSNVEGGNPNNYSDCLAAGGNWNMASVCTDAGFHTSTCTVNGEISAFGITVKGSYVKGSSYNIPWARYACTASNENCCVKQGLYTGETKLA